MIDGYTYSQYRDVYWYCSAKFQGCKARVRYTGVEVVKVMTDHTHPPPKIAIQKYIHNENDEIIMIPSSRSKKHLLMLHGYTYSQRNYGPHWYCSSTQTQKCPARLHLFNNKLEKIMTDHTHPPPKYLCKNGKYIKV
ncbi:unnamed protein product [Pieris macdunnoughi]|uniref:FLYWCH-type domain-containing protein n=1 Tax=Pieris macdunnoughi TaxID=345717 RepID=A0A821QEP7_9NEOP|nr:unnamed protein product [Pieris macdunnoughi]